MLTDTTRSPYAKVHALDGMKVKWTGGLWKERFDTCANSTVPQLKHMFDSKDISHVVENFKICAGDAEGDFDGTVFGDGDFYKWMESAIYTAYQTDNQLLKKEIENYIDLIGRAQQPDGYLSTKQIIGERTGNGVSRMGDINDFEVYNFGHMFTAACVHKRITGKDNFLAIAAKTADYLEHLYEEAERTGEVQTAVCPSHYMGLVEMYRTTGDKRYLKLARQAIALRDSVKNGMDDNQDKIPLKQHEKILGHAVRANYLYAGVADLCLEEEDPDYMEVLHKVWRSLVDKKLYITGGCGALYNGASPYGLSLIHICIAEQNLVSISAGLAKCGKKPFACSPACFLSTRSYEQAKVDVAYSNTNVTLIGISGGISYGALGMSHHSAQDIAAMSAIPNMRVYLPSDRHQTKHLIEALLKDEKPSYIRVGRNPVEDIYTEDNCPFEMDKATVLKEGTDVAIIACGEMVRPAFAAAKLLEEQGISATVLDMYCVKPLDAEGVIKAAQNAKAVITVEEHAPFGGLGSMVAQVVGANCPKKVLNMALPDAPVITGNSQEVFDYYGLNAEGIAKKAVEALK